jgi:hypothetical protein
MMQFGSNPKKNEDPVASLLELEAIRIQFSVMVFLPCGNSEDVRKSVAVVNENLQ